VRTLRRFTGRIRHGVDRLRGVHCGEKSVWKIFGPLDGFGAGCQVNCL
jgi:hypothetical protein